MSFDAESTDVSTHRSDHPWRRAWLNGLGTWAAAAATYLLLNATFWMVRAMPAAPVSEFFNVWDRWDTGHYSAIAANGYDPSTGSAAFFPLYPMLMALVDPVLPGHLLAAALFVSSVACVAALAALYRLAEDLFDGGTAQRTTLFLMASPFGFYLVAGYNESLFLALSVASLYCMRRGNWWAAGAFAGLASATRYFGVVLGLAFVIEYLRQRDWEVRWVRWDALGLLLVPSGLIAYMVYSASAFGDPLRFARLQQTNWGHELNPPWVSIVDAIGQTDYWWDRRPFDTWAILTMVDLLAVPVILALLVLAAVGRVRLGPPAWYLTAFGAVAFLAVLVSPAGVGIPALHGLPRYALEMVPIYLVLARLGASRAFERSYLFPAIGLQAALLLSYFTHVYVS